MKKTTFRRSRTSLLTGGVLVTSALLSQGCLQREVKEQQPNTSNVFVEQIVNSSVNEIDMLFVIDNSVSMGDKQEILKQAVPRMVERLVAPNCVDTSGNVVGQSTLVDADTPPSCPSGSKLEFNPVNDIHLGVISSSLGGHGSSSCGRDEVQEGVPQNKDDRGRLVPTMRSNVPLGASGLGFLGWNGGNTAAADALIADFTEQVGAAGEKGCGFEAPLEAWYRFLVDPVPPDTIVVGGDDRATAVVDGNGATLPDNEVLAQRAAFLRPESLVAIVVLTDENDCSAMDGGSYYNNAGFGYLVTKVDFSMPIATNMCATNPNDKCCFSCLQSGSPPSGCSAEAAVCQGSGPPLAAEQDRVNVRCYENKRRFGVDLLYPTQRYVDALKQSSIIDARTGTEVNNPLFVSADGKVRDPELVFFAGIVGVPWQDISTPETLSTPNNISYLTAQQLRGNAKSIDGADLGYDYWELILGKPGLSDSSKACTDGDDASCGQAPVAPKDPFMIESIVQRIGEGFPVANPIVPSEAIVDSTSNNPKANNINGHEADHTKPDASFGLGNDDLQYACIFPLKTPKLTDECAASASCDCAGEPSRNRSLCQPPAGGPAVNSQYFGKAYPGTRILQVLKDFGANSIVGSICPKVTDETQNDFGYNPAVQAIVDRLAEKLTGTCLPRELTIDEEGKVPCFVVEAKPPAAAGDVALNCAGNGRAAVSADIRKSVEKQLAETNRCDGKSPVACVDYQMCIINELEGGGRDQCLLNDANADSLAEAGFCYIDPAKGPSAGGVGAGCDPDDPSSWKENCTNPIVADCKATERRLLRFVGADTPAPNAITFVACTGDAASSDDPIPGYPDGLGGSGN